MTLSERTKKYCEGRAKKMADRLNTYFKTDVWVPNVWHNTWWCYDVTCGSAGSISVHEDEDRDEPSKIKYWTSMDDELGSHSATPSFWSVGKMDFEAPEAAVIAQIEYARKHVDEITAVINSNKKILNL